MHTVRIVCVEPATEKFVAFKNRTKQTVSAWNIHCLFIAVPSLFCVSYGVHSCSSFAQFRPIWSLCIWITSGIWIKNREVTCYLWHNEYIFGIRYVFIYSFTCTYYFFTFWSIVSSNFCYQRKCKWSWESNASVSAAIITSSIVSPLLCNHRHDIFKWK